MTLANVYVAPSEAKLERVVLRRELASTDRLV